MGAAATVLDGAGGTAVWAESIFLAVSREHPASASTATTTAAPRVTQRFRDIQRHAQPTAKLWNETDVTLAAPVSAEATV
ncbi:hypothetical protein Mkiyose1088_37240 [Mycobacterium kiyosense]|nr:hypothetical protein MKCMC460_33460 [Mycobacterium sp. 20KCMC460]GLB91170.1 hypothetical protein SRL2020130_39870 [Mycobacterium kiyosense]GLC02187.1 hypothetical protein SRL2020400_27780 [Mycobacterium kiyosense]GLC09607.1 hypothetical protein SRL2020411_42530 [Mycobacterium kiyosense]GLC15316.1 hypothetical protein SRL2020448_39190 [Mycobacterium kiyosense]